MILERNAVTISNVPEQLPRATHRRIARQAESNSEPSREGYAGVSQYPEEIRRTRTAEKPDGGSRLLDEGFERDRAAPRAFFHSNGTINYFAALQVGHIARSKAFRSAFRIAWQALKRAARFGAARALSGEVDTGSPLVTARKTKS